MNASQDTQARSLLNTKTPAALGSKDRTVWAGTIVIDYESRIVIYFLSIDIVHIRQSMRFNI